MDIIFRNILVQYFQWHFYDMSKTLFRIWKDFLWFNANYFSVPLLLKTFLSPWHKYSWQRSRGFDLWEYIEVAIGNLFSRTIGALIRFFLIIAGILTEILIFFAGAIVIFLWIFLPLLFILGLGLGIKIMF